MSTAHSTELTPLAERMAEALAEWNKRLPPKAMLMDGWYAKLSDATATLRVDVEAIGGVFAVASNDGMALKLGGIRSTSTTGLQGACRNWLAAARKQLEAHPD